jgi:myo-inositol catabolism protein IolC
MSLGYDGKLYMLAFDHRGSFTKRFGIEGDPTPEEIQRIADGKHLIFEGLETALARGADPSVSAALVDEQFGGPAQVPGQAKAKGIKLAMPVEKSGQREFDFEYGEDFVAHIKGYDPDFSKVLVRYNPDGDAVMNRRQTQRLRRLSDWLHEHDRKFLFELLVPAEAAQLASVDGDSDRYDTELRPDLMLRTISELQEGGVEPDIWKIEGVDERADCERIAAQCRAGGRDGVACVVLGRGADDDKVDHWLRQGAPVEAYIGFAIGRSIWGDPLQRFIDGSLHREDAAAQVADNYLRFVDVYGSAETPVGPTSSLRDPAAGRGRRAQAGDE